MFLLLIFYTYIHTFFIGNTVITNTTKYQDLIGSNAKGNYVDKNGLSEEIFPIDIKNLNILDFKMVYYSFFSNQYVAYLVVDYKNEEYVKEIERLETYGICKDCLSDYGSNDFEDYELIAVNLNGSWGNDHGFLYAITDGKNKIVYVEMIFENSFTDIKVEDYVPNEYLPIGLDVSADGPKRQH